MNYLDNRYVTEQTLYSATVGVRFNLFDGLASTGRLRAALEREQQSRRQLRALEAQAALDYQIAGNDARVAAARIAVARDAIRQAEENLRINQERYLAQVATSTEVIDAQMLLTRSRAAYFQAQFDHQISLARLRRAAGDLGEGL